MPKYLLKGLISSKGYTLKSFSTASNIEYQRVKKICSNNVNIRLDDIIKICRTLNLSPLIFFPQDVRKMYDDETILQDLYDKQRQEEQP